MRILIAAFIALGTLAIGIAEAASGIVVEHPWEPHSIHERGTSENAAEE